ncbi:MAG: hypothetical protein ACOCZ7_04230 [Armatimonadota bacterium]
MKRWHTLVLGALLLTSSGVAPAQADDAEDQARASELIEQSQQLVDEEDFDAAMDRLLEALEIAPDRPSVHAHLGYLYELQDEPLKALASYGRLLELRPDDEYGRDRVTGLFYDGQFPRRLRMGLLQFSPVSFVTDICRVQLESGLHELERRIAYTSGVIFPEEMEDGQGPIVKEIPSAGGQGAVGEASFNRTCYGYVAVPEGEDLRMTAMVHYPSALLSESGNDYSGLAERIAHIVLRTHCYSRAAYGLPSADDQEVVRVWITESGPTGAEQYEDDIFVYDAGRERTPEEWLRQIAHEWGHHVLPMMGRFTEPEPDAAGALGEALFLQLLAHEAGLVVDDVWPSERAEAAINGLWGNGEVALRDFLADTRKRTMDLWLAEGPNSQLAAGLDEDSFNYLVGMLLWVEAAHGHGMLRSTLLNAPGETPADYYYAYRQAIKEAAGQGEITLYAGAYDPGASTFTAAPREGALRRENVTLAAGDRAWYPVYLLEGPATVRVAPGLRQTKLNLYVDEIGPLPIEGGEAVSLGQREQGWHTLMIEAPEDCGQVTLDRFVVTTGESDVPAPGL